MRNLDDEIQENARIFQEMMDETSGGSYRHTAEPDIESDRVGKEDNMGSGDTRREENFSQSEKNYPAQLEIVMMSR